MRTLKIIVFILLPIVFLMGLVVLFWPERTSPSKIETFDDCVNAGNPVMESYPRQCRTADGRTFVEDIGNILEKQDLIRVISPQPNQVIESPLEVVGEARGFWFFEASFPIKLVDKHGADIAFTIATAETNWMTEDFVPFRATLEFDQSNAGVGELLLMKDNPSGDPLHDDLLRIPVMYAD